MVQTLVALAIRLLLLFIIPDELGLGGVPWSDTALLMEWINDERAIGFVSYPYPAYAFLKWVVSLGFNLRLPGILADVAITYLISKKAGKWGWVYAFNPISIFVCAIQGNIDTLAVLPVVLAVVTGWGWLCGLSFKIFPPLYLVAFDKKHWWGIGFVLLGWLAGYLVWGKAVVFEYGAGGLGYGYNAFTWLLYKLTGYGMEMLTYGKVIFLAGLFFTAWKKRDILPIALSLPVFAPFWSAHYNVWLLPILILSKRKEVFLWIALSCLWTGLGTTGALLQSADLFRASTVGANLFWLYTVYWYVREMRDGQNS